MFIYIAQYVCSVTHCRKYNVLGGRDLKKVEVNRFVDIFLPQCLLWNMSNFC